MKFFVLGILGAADDAGPVRLGGSRQRAVLAALLGSPNRPVSMDRLVDAVWGEGSPKTAVDNVRLYVHQLRRVLGPDRIVRQARGYCLAIGPDELDSRRFEDLTDRGRHLLDAADARAAADVLRDALALWRGQPYADLADLDWLRPEIDRLNERRLAALELRLDADLALGRHDLVVAELVQQTAEQPLRERLRVQLMLALFEGGRTGEALGVYRDARRRLANDLGVDPGPALTRTHQAILTGDVGELAVILGSRQGAPIADEPSGSPFLLPPHIPDFTGRAGDLALIRDRFARGSARGSAGDSAGDSAETSAKRRPAVMMIAGVCGMAGVGKTALAVRAAHELVEAFPDGQLFVNLRGAESSPLDSGEVLARFLRALGVDSRSIPAATVERADLYRARLAKRRVLVLLDNAASEAQIRPLLPGLDGCAVLVTSRVRLSGIEGATWLELREFGTAEAVELLTGVVDGDARAGGRVDAEPEQAAAIADLCGGLPLAVRVAGARLAARPAWRLAHLADLLADERRRLGHLAAGDLEVRSSLSLSYQGLDEAGRRLLRRLAMFDVPDFPHWLAPAVLDGPAGEASELLEGLVDAQMLSAIGTDAAGQIRYRFHDLVRLYARELAEAQDTDEDRARSLHRGLGAWLTIAEEMAGRVPGPCYAPIHGSAVRTPAGHDVLTSPDVDALAWFDAEHASLLSAVHQACDLRLDELAFDLAGSLEKYFDVRGRYQDWRATNERVMSLCLSTGNLRGQAVMLRGLIDVVTWNTENQPPTGLGSVMDRLCADATRLMQLFTELGERAGQADAAVITSWGLTAAGRYRQAIESATWALTTAAACGHVGGRARAHVALALAHGQSQQLEQAMVHLGRALEDARSLGNPRYLATVLQFLGIAHRETGDLTAGLRALQESLAICRTYGDPYTQTLTMIALARLYLALGDPRAAPAAESALRLGREHHMGHHLADALAALGEIALTDGRPEIAVTHLGESVAMWRTRGWPTYLAAALRTLGAAQSAADPEAAENSLLESQEIVAELGRVDRNG
jgi:DNA-binding SARP family transcriptional activator/TPR repeat protein